MCLAMSDAVDNVIYNIADGFRHLSYIFAQASDPLVVAVRENNQSELNNLLSSETVNKRKCYPHSVPLLSVAVMEGHANLVQTMIEMGASIRAMDSEGYTPIHYAVWKCKPPNFPPPRSDAAHESYECESADGLVLLDILLKSLENDSESLLRAAYFDADKNRHSDGISPFLLACAINSDSVLERFLAVLDRSPDPLPIEIFSDRHGINALHYVIISSIQFQATPRRAGILESMIDKVPNAQILLHKRHKRFYSAMRKSPMDIAISDARISNQAVVDVLKTVLRHATIEEVEKDPRAVYYQIIHQRSELVEVLLRVGLPMADDFLNSASRRKKRIIELLLAFGYPLHKELGLYSEDELPIEITSTPEYADKKAQYATYVSSDVVEALRSVRRSNVLLSLQRQCRTKIRHHLRPRADEAIKELPLPSGVKQFLLVENEPPLLEISE